MFKRMKMFREHWRIHQLEEPEAFDHTGHATRASLREHLRTTPPDKLEQHVKEHAERLLKDWKLE